MKTKNIFFSSLLVFLSLVTAAYAVSYDLKEDTPTVRKAISGRQARYSELQSLKDQGIIGETNQGYVKSFSPSSESFAEDENADRRTIYHAIVKQNNLDPSSLEQVQATFAEVQRHKARNGHSVQLVSGEWQKK